MCAGGAKQEDDSLLAGIAAVIGTGDPDEVDVWEANSDIWMVFDSMQSQWNVGMGGVVGLRYEALPLVYEARHIKPKQRSEVFDGLRVMERAAVDKINKS